MKLIAILIIISILIFKIRAQTNVKITVYYSPFCGDTKEFFLTNLQNAVDKVSSIMDLELIPFGKAKVSNF
jgi:hypothetical protein